MAGPSRLAIATPFGLVWLHGQESAFEDTGRPVLLVVTGAFAPRDAFDRVQQRLPQAACLTVHLPGNHSPLLSETSVAAFASAFDHAVETLERPTHLCGSSLGGVVALGMRAAPIRSIVAIDPPLTNSRCGLFAESFRSRLARQPDNRALAEFLSVFFGFDNEGWEPRDFTPVLHGLGKPAAVLVGGEAGEIPGLMDEVALAACRAEPAVSLARSARGGHNLVREDPGLILAALERALAAG